MRTPRTAGAGALALTFVTLTCVAACSNVPAKAATVDGSTISRSDFERDLQALADNPGLVEISGGTEVSIASETARGWLRNLITWTAAEEVLAGAGLEPTREAVDAVRAELTANETAQNLPRAMLDDIEQGVSAANSLTQIPAPSPDQLEESYAVAPASTGALCARHILVDTEAEARAVLEELDGGADFADLAAERSIEPAAADTGGALGGQDGNACLPITTYQESFDRAFSAGALAAVPGQPTDPVKSEFGYHVILVRPYEEVADDLAAIVAAAPGEAALAGMLATADITVDPRYGQWDGARGAVVPLG